MWMNCISNKYYCCVFILLISTLSSIKFIFANYYKSTISLKCQKNQSLGIGGAGICGYEVMTTAQHSYTTTNC